MSDDSRDVWKILAALGTLALVGFAVVDFLSAPSADVEVEVSHAVQYQPPGVRQVMEMLVGFRYGGFQPALPPDAPLRDMLPDSMLLDAGAYELHEEVWRASVSNEGDASADSVVIHLPHADYARVDREGQEPVYGPVREGVIELGMLRPMRTIELTVWSSFSTGRWRIYGDDIFVSHREGRGSVSYIRPVGGVYQWLSGNIWATALVGYLSLMGLVMVAAVVTSTFAGSDDGEDVDEGDATAEDDNASSEEGAMKGAEEDQA